jgi:hypothetical protein
MNWMIAYANESTNYDWHKCGILNDFQAAVNTCRDWSTTNMKNSALGIFAIRDNDPVDWRDKKPRRIYNRWVLTQDAPIPASLGGLINSLESDWF